MVTKTELLRRRIVDSGSSLSYTTSLSQRNLADQIAMERKVLGDSNSKGAKAERRRKAHQQFIDDELPKQQFERGIRHIMNGGSTPEELSYVLRHLGKYEHSIEGNSEITIVELATSETVTE